MNKLPRLDKKVLSVGTLKDIDDEKAFWLSKNIQERLAAIELNREMVYGQDRVTSRLQRFLEISELTGC
ncbi:hypothetical protein KKG61_02580 [bacterium]|nr:hypothetical protein [bacterium]MBU1598986.1 hypothetical protein [bacterium]MBU2462401.1 hypothetical protein [bacterium]